MSRAARGGARAAPTASTIPLTRIAAAGAPPRPLFDAAGEPWCRLQEDLASGEWELEVGFGKGRYLLRRAAGDPGSRFLGIELVGEYFRLAARRAARRGLTNLTLLQGEALYLLQAVLPPGFARALHVYFPDPWPKSRHQRRRLFDRESLDLVLGVLRPGGRLFFASDHPAYGPAVADLLEAWPGLEVRRRAAPWEDGARTNYEAKYVDAGREIVRLEAVLTGLAAPPVESLGCAWERRQPGSPSPAAG